MYFKAPVKMKGKSKYYYEINIDESYAEGVVDEWGAAFVWNKKGQGAEYNLCYDGRNEMSAIYKADEYETDPTTYEHYEIDFSDDEWKQKLINRMIECTERWWN
jgi:hypothetical protein